MFLIAFTLVVTSLVHSFNPYVDQYRFTDKDPVKLLWERVFCFFFLMRFMKCPCCSLRALSTITLRCVCSVANVVVVVKTTPLLHFGFPVPSHELLTMNRRFNEVE